MIKETEQLKQEVNITKGVVEKEGNNFAKVLISKSVPSLNVTINEAVVGARKGANQGEGADIVKGTKAKRDIVTNQMAIYADLIQVSRTAELTNKFALKTEVESALEGYIEYLEEMAIKGCTVAGRTNKGLITFTPAANKQTVTGEVTAVKLSAALKNLKSKADIVVCGFEAALKLDALKTKAVIVNGDNALNGTLDKVQVRNADAVILISPAMEDNQALFLNTAYLSRRVLTDGKVEKLPKRSFDGSEFELVDESCVFYNYPNALALVTFAEEE